MSLPDLLLLPLYLLALLVPAVGVVLTKAALEDPRIDALTFMAGFVDAVGFLILAYLWAVANYAFSYPIPREVGQVAVRAALITIGLLCVYFLRLYRKGALRDGGA